MQPPPHVSSYKSLYDRPTFYLGGPECSVFRVRSASASLESSRFFPTTINKIWISQVEAGPQHQQNQVQEGRAEAGVERGLGAELAILKSLPQESAPKNEYYEPLTLMYAPTHSRPRNIDRRKGSSDQVLYVR